MTTAVVFAGEPVVTEKLTLLLPLGTVTDAGTGTKMEFEPSDTAKPLERAFPLRLTVQVLCDPPLTLAGLQAIAVNVGDCCAIVTDALDPDVAMALPPAEAAVPPLS